MCGRYSVLTEDEIIEIRSILHDISLRLSRDDLENYEASPGEVRPTDKSPIIAMNSDGISFESAKFGFKKWDGKGVIINARSDTLQKPNNMFSKIKNIGRCVVPAKEYYEWKEQNGDDNAKLKTKKKKIKHFIKDKAGNLLFFAGLYQDTHEGREFVIITKDAHGDVTDIHDRMPVILLVNQLEHWLNGELTPDDITKMDFNASVAPCDEEPDGKKDDNSDQMSLF